MSFIDYMRCPVQEICHCYCYLWAYFAFENKAVTPLNVYVFVMFCISTGAALALLCETFVLYNTSHLKESVLGWLEVVNILCYELVKI
jgi:hypothetical protein